MTAAVRLGRLPSALPPRYSEDWWGCFHELIGSRLGEGACVLDVGSGRRPAVRATMRPPGCRYVGLDISRDELLMAPAGSYDEIVCGDLTDAIPALHGRFDLIVSVNVLEHLADPGAAVAHLRSYLRKNGRLVAILSGRYSCFGLANRYLPNRLGQYVAAYVTKRAPDTVFPAYYRDCSYDGLHRILSDWTVVDIRPMYRGEVYFRFSRVLLLAYLAYESWACRTRRSNLATHYFFMAEP